MVYQIRQQVSGILYKTSHNKIFLCSIFLIKGAETYFTQLKNPKLFTLIYYIALEPNVVDKKKKFFSTQTNVKQGFKLFFLILKPKVYN